MEKYSEPVNPVENEEQQIIEIESETTEEKKKGLSKSKKVLIGIGVAGLTAAVVLASVFGGNKNKPAGAILPSNPLTSSASSNPNISSSETQAETLPTVESLEMSSSLLSDPNKLAETFFDTVETNWVNAGAIPESAEPALKSSDISDYSAKIASEYDELYIKALLPDNWQSNQSLVGFVNRLESVHKAVVQLYFETSFPELHPEDKAPYRMEYTASSISNVIKNDDGTVVTMDVITHDTDNSDKNHAGKIGANVDTSDYIDTWTFSGYGDIVKLTGNVEGGLAS